MTRIRATCPSCGEVELRPDDVVLRRVLTDDGDVADGSSYRFSCPDCDVLIEKPADDRVASLLTTGGVPTEDVPALRPLPPHPETPRGGAALGYDDLLDLHLALRDPAWFDRFAASTART